MKLSVIVLAVAMFLATATLPAACHADTFPNWATLNLWVGNGPSGQYAQWTLTELSMQNEAYVANAGNVHIAFYNDAAWRNYYSAPVSLGQSATNSFCVWVDDSYVGDYVDVSWSWTTNGPANAGYQWLASGNFVGWFRDYDHYDLTSSRGVLRFAANTNPYTSDRAEYIGFTVTNVPEPSSLIGLLPGLGGIAFLKRRRR